jgi:hypothetical protein
MWPCETLAKHPDTYADGAPSCNFLVSSGQYHTLERQRLQENACGSSDNADSMALGMLTKKTAFCHIDALFSTLYRLTDSAMVSHVAT